jgi:hypothetical protein
MFHIMNICAVALSIASLIFSSHMLYSTCAGQGRTYYLACASRAEADEWANAIRNNVAALPKEASKYSCFYSLSLSLSLCGLLWYWCLRYVASCPHSDVLPVQCPLPARSAVRTATRR